MTVIIRYTHGNSNLVKRFSTFVQTADANYAVANARQALLDLLDSDFETVSEEVKA